MATTGGGPSRRSHTTSRKGCKTCKGRHIRCDETFPQCRKCTKHQVRCDYMDSVPQEDAHNQPRVADQKTPQPQLLPSPTCSSPLSRLTQTPSLPASEPTRASETPQSQSTLPIAPRPTGESETLRSRSRLLNASVATRASETPQSRPVISSKHASPLSRRTVSQSPTAAERTPISRTLRHGPVPSPTRPSPLSQVTVPARGGPHVSPWLAPIPDLENASPRELKKHVVLEYLSKKGYNKTEATLRQESTNIDASGRPVVRRAEDRAGEKYFVGFNLLHTWVEDNLELYKAELRRLLWPVFVYSFLNLVSEYYPEMSKKFFDEYNKHFTREHAEDLRLLEPISSPEHIEASPVATMYRTNKYRLTLTQAVYYNLIQQLELKEKEGGSVVLSILQTSMLLVTIERTSAGNDRAFASMIAKLHGESDIPDEDEGIPGHHPGTANTNPDAPKVLTRLYLGALPMETEMSMDVRDELAEEDAQNPPRAGENSLIEELEQRIKREPSDEAPNRDAVPLPKPLARDVAREVAKVKELRDRFKIGSRTGGVAAGISVTMFTFHNTYDSVTCMDFSGDTALVAVGTSESYIRVWSLEGKPLPSITTNDPNQPKFSASRRLIGHSGPVYAVSFSPSIINTTNVTVPTRSRHLLSCSADKSVRLWSLDTWSCLVVYKGHDRPVWDITWGPFGHYFLTGSNDRTARLWSTDQIAPLRLFVGHDQDVDCVAFHPNNAYVFTASSDKTVRMWDVSRGTAVRLFTGHTANITALSCSPSGRTLASADDAGNIILWDLAAGRRMKRMRGHGKGGIWSLSWSVESTLLVSGGADATVRVWDVLQQTEGAAAANKNATDVGGTASAGGAKSDGTTKAGGAATNGVVQGVINPAMKKGKGRDAAVTEDQISAFPTKKSPVYKVMFTHMNLVLAGGCYFP